jgi:hypothetical protein
VTEPRSIRVVDQPGGIFEDPVYGKLFLSQLVVHSAVWFSEAIPLTDEEENRFRTARTAKARKSWAKGLRWNPPGDESELRWRIDAWSIPPLAGASTEPGPYDSAFDASRWTFEPTPQLAQARSLSAVSKAHPTLSSAECEAAIERAEALKSTNSELQHAFRDGALEDESAARAEIRLRCGGFSAQTYDRAWKLSVVRMVP